MMHLKKRLFAWFMPLLLLLSLGLGGCVRYDLGINFTEQHYGEIVQHIQLSQQLTTLSQSEADKWLASLESRAKALRGYSQRVSDQELIVTIPFGSGQELVDKFNTFFNPKPPQGAGKIKDDQLDLLQLKAEMAIQQSNWFFVDQNRLRLSVDLRALGVLSNQGNIIVSPGSLIDLDFSLNTPFLVRNGVNEDALSPEATSTHSQLLWKLKPGQVNVLEAVFWVPSYLASAGVGIIALSLAGFYLKYKRWPGVLPQAIAE
jgi:hypothetical protein